MECGLTAVMDELERTGSDRADYAVYRCARDYEGVPPAKVWYGRARKPVPALASPSSFAFPEGWFQFTIWKPSALLYAKGVLVEFWDWEKVPQALLDKAEFRIEDTPRYRDTPAFYWSFWRWNEWRIVRPVLADQFESLLCVPASMRLNRSHCSSIRSAPLEST